MAILLLALVLVAQDPDVASLIQELRSDEASRRNAATAKLEKLGAASLPALRAALQNSADPEIRPRLEKVIGEIEIEHTRPHRIVFTRGEETGGELYLWENGEVRRLTENKKIEAGPRISPDGNRLVYFSMGSMEESQKADVLVMTLADRSVVRVGAGFEPAWSPDGTRIAYLGETEIHIAAADGTGGKVVFHSDSPVRSVCWSSDGKELAFERDETIWILTLAGAATRRVGGATAQATTLARWSWSPDGKTFAMVAGSGPYLWNIYTVGRDGSDLAARTADGWVGHGIAEWAPDSRRVAVCVALGSGGGRPDPLPGGLDTGLHILDSKLGVFRRAAKDVSPTLPRWSEDGRFILYVTSKDEIWICHAATGAVRKVTEMAVPLGAAASWFPPTVHWPGK